MTGRSKIKVETVFTRMPLLRQVTRALRSSHTLVGIPAEKAVRHDEETGKFIVTNAFIGYINEFGSEKMHIPPRPFLIPAIEENAPAIAAAMKPKDLLKIDPHEALERAGIRAVSLVQQRITEQTDFAPLSPVTLAFRKAKHHGGPIGTKALIDTGQLRQSITYVVED